MSLTPKQEKAVLGKVFKRLLPVLIVSYFVAFLDRVNVGFAALTMNEDLGFSAAAFGFGAGIFFFGYFLFEVPSNILLHRIGARRWIARIMLSWGVVSGSMAFVWNETSFYVARFLLGAMEAGFFPGIILYLTYWVPAEQRAKVIGTFIVAVPISSVIGSPISGWILSTFHGTGSLAGWQWLFLIEAAPAVLMGIVVLMVLCDRPEQAGWLTPEEKAGLSAQLEAERRQQLAVHPISFAQIFTHPRVLALAMVYLGINIASYGIGLWLPQIVRDFGLDAVQTGFVAAIPFAVAASGMIFWTRHSDRSRERIWHVAAPAFVGAAAFACAAYAPSPLIAMIALSVAALCIYMAIPTFWTLPTVMLTGTAAAGGIALINSIGALGGFFGPYLFGWVKDATGHYVYGLVFLGSCFGIAGLIVLRVGRKVMAGLSDLKTSGPRE